MKITPEDIQALHNVLEQFCNAEPGQDYLYQSLSGILTSIYDRGYNAAMKDVRDNFYDDWS